MFRINQAIARQTNALECEAQDTLDMLSAVKSVLVAWKERSRSNDLMGSAHDEFSDVLGRYMRHAENDLRGAGDQARDAVNEARADAWQAVVESYNAAQDEASEGGAVMEARSEIREG